MRIIDGDDLLSLWSVKSGKRFIIKNRDNFTVTVSLVDVQKSIKDAPTVDAVPVVHAHWIVKGDDDMDNEMYHCSNCGEEQFFDNYYEQEKFPYCPMCGAKMDESVKE